MSTPFMRLLFILLVFLFYVSPVLAETLADKCGKEWEWVTPLPQGNALHAVTWSQQHQQYVAVGEAGTILTSEDGFKWQVQIT